MLTIKKLMEEVKAYNLDTDEELDLDALADIDLDALLSGDFRDEMEDDPIYFDDDLSTLSLSDLAARYEEDTNNLDINFGDIGGSTELDDTEFGEYGTDFQSDSNELQNEELALGDGNLAPEEFGEETIGEFGPEEEVPEEDADFQGEIRTVKGANLVYKRQMENGNFEELWVYNVGNDMKRETQIRRAILAGTDINPSTQESEDGNQYSETSSMGNIQFLHIIGMPQ